VYSASLRPSLALGRYPERQDVRNSWIERTVQSLGAAAERRRRARSGYINEICSAIHKHTARYAELEAPALAKALVSVRQKLVSKEHSEQLIAQTFALIREYAGRTLGMQHFDCQLMGGWVIFHGMLAEMNTGEGKTLTASLPAATAALAGIPVHVVTVNDYLATRDAELMRPLYEALGLSVGIITEEATPAERKTAYRCDITYCTNKQLTFDYLKDRLVLGRGNGRIQLQVDRLDRDNSRHGELLLRGLCFAIVDEADSVLIDEARTPLILSRAGDGKEEKQIFDDGLMIAAQLREGQDYFIDSAEHAAKLTVEGEERIAHLGDPLGGVWSSVRRRRELIGFALAAQHLFLRDKHYIVRDEKVQIIDEYTGRVMPDRSWARGLHQMVQAKEGVEVSGRNETLAKISYQRFFRRYLRLGGMSGTAREVAGELTSVYGLNVVPVPTNRPSQRRQLPDRVYATKEEKWRAVIADIKQCQNRGQPVLVGTRTVEDSEMLGARLEKAGIEHEVLNARQDMREAEIVARAGERGRVTVATNIAGRGTDIPIETAALDCGGLHVIVTERFEAGRIDRQLVGRCARQGDPGSAVAILSIEDELADLYYPKALRWSVDRSAMRGEPLRGWAGAGAIRMCQRLLERRHARMRAELYKQDQQQSDRMAFAGRPE